MQILPPLICWLFLLINYHHIERITAIGGPWALASGLSAPVVGLPFRVAVAAVVPWQSPAPWTAARCARRIRAVAGLASFGATV